MRTLLVATALTAAFALAQTTHEARPFAEVRPDIAIVVQEHPTGADLVDVALLKKEYPPELLRRQIERLGELLGSPPRGLRIFQHQIDPQNPKLTFLKANFGVDGLIDRDAGTLGIEPILKAFAGAPPEHRIVGLSIMFGGEKPTRNMVRVYESAAVQAEAREVNDPSGIEYRVLLKSQNAAEVRFPSGPVEPMEPELTSEHRAAIPPYAWVALVAAGVSAGALVYLALLRSRGVQG